VPKVKSIRFLSQKSAILTLALILQFCLMLSLNAAVARADEVKWSEVNLPSPGKAGNWVLAPGSDIQYLTRAVDGSLYAYGKGLTYTLYQSTNNGYSWSYIGKVQDSMVAIATLPQDAKTIYYATASTVYKSTDGGKNLTSLPPNPGGAGSGNIEITSIAVTRLYSSIIAVATRDMDSAQFGGIYLLNEEKLIPGWVNSNLSGYDVYAVAFSPNYAADRQLVAVVTDETNTFVTTKVGEAGWGATFGNARLTQDNSGTPVAVNVSAMIAFPGDYDATAADYTQFVAINTGVGKGDVYRIDGVAAPGNSLATDLNIGAAYGLSNVDVTGLAARGNTSAAKLLAGAAASTRVYFSADGGKNWTKSAKEPTGGSKTYVLMAGGLAFAATSGSDSAFSISQDNGVTWNQIGLIDTNLSSIIDLAPSPNYRQDSTLFLLTFGSEQSLWRSQNGGITWERIFSTSLANVDSLDLVRLPPQYGNNRRVVFIAGSAGGVPAIWKSTDNGQNFVRRNAVDPDTGAPITVNTWVIISDTTFLIASYDGTNGRVYQTTNSGFFYTEGTSVGTQSLNSIVLSPTYEQDQTILVGNTAGWVYWSCDNGASFEPLPPNATSPPLTGAMTVAFDSAFLRNKTVYAASSTANKGIYRFVIGKSTQWERIDSTLPSGGTINQLIVSMDGTLYATNSQANGGTERSLDPTYSLGPTFETVARGLSSGATLTGLWQVENTLWSIDTTNIKLVTFTDTLTSPVTLVAPTKNARGVGILRSNSISNVSLDWQAMTGATSYKWQIDSDTDFSSVPSGFEGNIKASSVRLPSLEPGTTYYWRVRVTEPILSLWSERGGFTTSLATESISLKLESPKAGASGVPIKLIFQWSAVPGAEAYELLVSTDINFSDPVIAKTGDYALPTTAWQCNISLNYDTTYYWKVRAISASTSSAWSAAGAFTTESPPSPPTVSAPPPPAPPPVAAPPPTIILTQPFVPPPLTPPPPAQTSMMPNGTIYLIGALLFTNLLLVITILVLVITLRRA